VLVELYIYASIIIAYGLFITIAIIGFGRLKLSLLEKKKINSSYISIVISARNEAENIEDCIAQIVNQNYPKDNFELIIVDDDSDDDTYTIAFNVLKDSGLSSQLVKQINHKGKKHNISEAIKISKGSIIITTDADVILRSSNWLSTISNYFNTYSPNMLVMPIDYESNVGLLGNFQVMENIALTGITSGYCGLQKPFMCNGANLAFKKRVFEQVNGYQSHLHISSGEDLFLLEDVKKIDSNSIHYGLLKDLIVKTKTINTMPAFLKQRIRWAYKSKYNPNLMNLFSGFVIIAANLLIVFLLLAMLTKSVVAPYLLIFVIVKFVFDFLLVFLASKFLGRIKFMWWFIPFESIYWMYVLIVGTASLFLKPNWKGKKIN